MPCPSGRVGSNPTSGTGRSLRLGPVDSRQRREARVARDGRDLVGQLAELDAGDELLLAAQGSEEVVVVGGQDDAGVEPGKDSLPVARGDPSAGDPGQEDVDRFSRELVVVPWW
jgi:hypothetical protein